MIESKIKRRTRLPIGSGRKHTIPIRLSEDEYRLIIDAAYLDGCTPSTYVANTALEGAKKRVDDAVSRGTEVEE